MDRTPQSKRTEHARQLRREGRFDEAATYYAAAAHGWFMRFRPINSDSPPAFSLTHLGYGVQDLSVAVLCCRLCGETKQAEYYCQIGVHVLKLLRDYDPNFQNPSLAPEQGLFEETLGDFRLLGNFGGHNEHYDSAMSHYRKVDNPRNWQAESEFHSIIQTVLELADSVDYNINDGKRRRIEHESLVERLEFKRKHYPQILSLVLTEGSFELSVI